MNRDPKTCGRLGQISTDDRKFTTPTQGSPAPTEPPGTPVSYRNSPLPFAEAPCGDNTAPSVLHTVSKLIFTEILQGQTS